MDTGGSDVEAELANADSQTVPALVADAEDTATVGEDGDAGAAGGEGDVVEDLGDVALVLDGEGETLRATVDL